VLEASDGVAVEAILSIKEPTRIRIDGAPITDVFGNIHSSNCGAAPSRPAGTTAAHALPPINPAGEIVLECDRDKGEIYIRPVGDSGQAGQPVHLLGARHLHAGAAPVGHAGRHHRHPRQDAQGRQRADSMPRPLPPLGSSPNHIRALKALLVAMASDRVPPDIRVDETNRRSSCGRSALLADASLRGRGLVGEKYLLQNVSQAPMVLAEQEFDREAGGVLASLSSTTTCAPARAPASS
jgi:conjugal transfer pilus assembly protein TraK